MKIRWGRIPKCFTYIAMDEDGEVNVFTAKPYIVESSVYDGIWGSTLANKDVRRLYITEEYDLEETDTDWKKILYQRCPTCNGAGYVDACPDFGNCYGCKKGEWYESEYSDEPLCMLSFPTCKTCEGKMGVLV